MVPVNVSLLRHFWKSLLFYFAQLLSLIVLILNSYVFVLFFLILIFSCSSWKSSPHPKNLWQTPESDQNPQTVVQGPFWLGTGHQAMSIGI